MGTINALTLEVEGGDPTGGTKATSTVNHCGSHMQVARLVKHRRAARCEKATEMWLRQRDMEMSEKCG